jgi:very-short-patch-repair endonuclease
MVGKTVNARSARAWELARKQHGVVSREQLLDLEFSERSVEHRLRTGRLYSVRRGVYAVGRPQISREGRWMAAILACGRGAALSHGSAAMLWGIGRETGRRIDISVRRPCNHRLPGIKARTRPTLPLEDITEENGIPITAPARTLIDLATELTPKRLERAVNEADKRDLIDSEALRVALDDHAGERGVRPLRTLLDRQTFRLSDTELEVLFRPIAVRAGLPTPLTKEMVNGFEVDFYWPDLGLVVETDGWHYHRTASAQTRDALRDQTHTATGLTPLRFSHYQVKYEPQHVRDVLSRTAANLRPEP